MTEEMAVQTVSDSVMSIEQSRAIQEVQASLVIAKKFPRDQDAAYVRIMKACERFSLANQAEYAYPRGGQTVAGPSIRLAEVLAQNWGNLTFGIRELSQSHGESEVEAFAWDLETNVKETKTFTVKHQRYKRGAGNVDLSDPRDIYEHTANQGARRMRACILGVIPGDIVESAQAKCRSTVEKGIGSKPLSDQVRVTIKNLDNVGVTKDMIEKRLGHKTDIINAEELIELNKINRSLYDNMTSREEWFTVKGEQQEKPNYTAKDLKTKLDAGDKEVEGYSPMKEEEPEPSPLEQGEPEPEKKGPTVDPLTGEDLEQDESVGTLPDGIDALSWLIPCRPTSSVANAKSYLKVFEEQESEINMLADRKLRDRLIAKQKLAKSYLAAKEPEKEVKGQDIAPVGRSEFEEKMKAYMAKDSDKYAKVLMDNDLDSMDATKAGDEDAILYFMSMEFGE